MNVSCCVRLNKMAPLRIAVKGSASLWANVGSSPEKTRGCESFGLGRQHL